MRRIPVADHLHFRDAQNHARPFRLYRFLLLFFRLEVPCSLSDERARCLRDGHSNKSHELHRWRNRMAFAPAQMRVRGICVIYCLPGIQCCSDLRHFHSRVCSRTATRPHLSFQIARRHLSLRQARVTKDLVPQRICKLGCARGFAGMDSLDGEARWRDVFLWVLVDEGFAALQDTTVVRPDSNSVAV